MQVLFFSSRRRHTRYWRDWSSDVCSSDLVQRMRRDRILSSTARAFLGYDPPPGVQLARRPNPRDAYEDARIFVERWGKRSEERRAGKERRSRWSPYH